VSGLDFGDAEQRLVYLRMAAEGAPRQLRPYLFTAAPAIVKLWMGLEKGCGAVWHLFDSYNKRYHLEDLMPCILGLLMAFYGSDFPLLIGAVVALRVTGIWQGIYHGFSAIWQQVETAWQATLADDRRDDNGDGVADVSQIPQSQLLIRKMLVVGKAVDPSRVKGALVMLWAGLLAVVASLKLRFAKSMTLGSAIGDIVTRPVLRHCTPFLKRSVDEDLHKWIEPGVNYVCRFTVMCTAFWFARVVAAVHSAVQGGQLFTTSLARFLHKRGLISFNPAASNLDELAGYVVAGIGLWWQLFYSTPLLLSLLFLPLQLLEWALRFFLVYA